MDEALVALVVDDSAPPRHFLSSFGLLFICEGLLRIHYSRSYCAASVFFVEFGFSMNESHQHTVLVSEKSPGKYQGHAKSIALTSCSIAKR
mmetsp:Transcript_30342/g.34087  ORF Transcript_30342/g.34087 Transcript_30342/m.34087 type:complete len:91 (+) Transcript_30342:456-728(+)